MHAAVLLALLASTTAAVAQCALQPTPTGVGVPSLNGFGERLVEWDPDGPGPLGPRLVASGAYTLAGDLVANGIAALDPATDQWSSMGDLGSPVFSFAVSSNGALLASGSFTVGASIATVQVWNGSAWSAALPQPSGVWVPALVAAANGDLFAISDSGFGQSIERFSGGVWQTIGIVQGSFGPFAATLLVDTNGDLLVGGRFSGIGGVPAANVARWNGSTWSAFGAGVTGTVYALLRTSTGNLVAGGLFSAGSPSVACNVARWTGTGWQSLGSGTQSPVASNAVVRSLAEAPAGVVVAGGQFTSAGGGPALKVARWNGTSWAPLGAGIEYFDPYGLASTVYALARTSAGELFAAGSFATASGRDAGGLARWNGTAWRPVRARGFGGITATVHRSSSGEVYVGGAFLEIDGVACNGIARRVGNAWQPLGAGVGRYGYQPPLVACVRTLANGDVVLGGQFPTAGGIASPGLARWNGTAWSSLGTGLGRVGNDPAVHAMRVEPSGDLLVAGVFDTAGGVPVESLARWDGSSWSAVGAGLTSAGLQVTLDAVASTPQGHVFVGGWFPLGGFATAKVAWFDGFTWQRIGSCDGSVRGLHVLPNGDLLAVGSFQNIDGQPTGCAARWNGTVWAPFGSVPFQPFDSAECVRELPGGALLLGGSFEQNGTYWKCARWDGTAWTRFHAAFGSVLDFAVDPSGEVLAAGALDAVNGVASAFLMRIVTPCPATVVASGTGCSGSGGPNALVADRLPWLGETFTATATGMPGSGLASLVFGLGTLQLPLASLLPQGGAGCALLVTPDVLGMAPLGPGPLAVGLPLPVAASLIGGVLHVQVVPFELTGLGAIASVTATNRLTLTLGLF